MAATRPGDDDQKTPVETDTTRDATSTHGRSVRPSGEAVEEDDEADDDAGSLPDKHDE